MGVYTILVEHTVTAQLEVRADSAEEAIEFAQETSLIEYANDTVGLDSTSQYDYHGSLHVNGIQEISVEA